MKHYNLAVVGGGFAGAAAAISAAREGLSVILADKSNCLGGAAVNCLVQPFMKNSTDIDGQQKNLSGGLYSEIRERLSQMLKEEGNDYKGNSFNEEHLKLILNRMALDAGVDILFHTYLIGADGENGCVKSIHLTGKSGEITVTADYFVDSTGDADLAYMLGFPCRLGREKDNLCQPMTLCFRLSNIDKEKIFKIGRNGINEVYIKLKEEGKIKNPREDVLWFDSSLKGVIHFNTTRIVKRNPVDTFDLTKAEIEAREQVYEAYKFIKENIEGCENAELMMTASEIGVRESRMIDGEYTLKGDEIIKCPRFWDSIACGNYEIDIHNPEGSGTSHVRFGKGEYYEIPYRTLIPKGSVNLLVAGRCISADHEAQASLRIMPIVCTIGEAAGAAVAVAEKQGKPVSKIDIPTLQEILIKKGAVIH